MRRTYVGTTRHTTLGIGLRHPHPIRPLFEQWPGALGDVRAPGDAGAGGEGAYLSTALAAQATRLRGNKGCGLQRRTALRAGGGGGGCQRAVQELRARTQGRLRGGTGRAGGGRGPALAPPGTGREHHVLEPAVVTALELICETTQLTVTPAGANRSGTPSPAVTPFGSDSAIGARGERGGGGAKVGSDRLNAAAMGTFSVCPMGSVLCKEHEPTVCYAQWPVPSHRGFRGNACPSALPLYEVSCRTPAFSGVPDRRGPNQNWLHHPCLLGGRLFGEGGAKTGTAGDARRANTPPHNI